MKTLKLSGNMRVIDIDRSTGECLVDGTAERDALKVSLKKSLRDIINLCDCKPEPCACKFADEGTLCMRCAAVKQLADLDK